MNARRGKIKWLSNLVFVRYDVGYYLQSLTNLIFAMSFGQ